MVNGRRDELPSPGGDSGERAGLGTMYALCEEGRSAVCPVRATSRPSMPSVRRRIAVS